MWIGYDRLLKTMEQSLDVWVNFSIYIYWVMKNHFSLSQNFLSGHIINELVRHATLLKVGTNKIIKWGNFSHLKLWYGGGKDPFFGISCVGVALLWLLSRMWPEGGASGGIVEFIQNDILNVYHVYLSIWVDMTMWWLKGLALYKNVSQGDHGSSIVLLC